MLGADKLGILLNPGKQKNIFQNNSQVNIYKYEIRKLVKHKMKLNSFIFSETHILNENTVNH